MSENYTTRHPPSRSRKSQRNSGCNATGSLLQSPFEPFLGGTVGNHQYRQASVAPTMPEPGQQYQPSRSAASQSPLDGIPSRPRRRRQSHTGQSMSQRSRQYQCHQSRNNAPNAAPCRDIFEDPDAIMRVEDDVADRQYDQPMMDASPGSGPSISIRHATVGDYKEVDANGFPKSPSYIFSLNPRSMGSLFFRRTGSSEFVETLKQLSRAPEDYETLFDSVVANDPSTSS